MAIALDQAPSILLLNTGIRVSELCALRWNDLRISDGIESIIVYTAKQHRDRHIPLNKAARKALDSLGYSQHVGMPARIFDGRSSAMTRCAVARSFNRYCKLAGLNERKDLMPLKLGVLRRTFAMNLLMDRIDSRILSALMGHKSLETTRLYYGHQEDNSDLADILKAVERSAAPRLCHLPLYYHRQLKGDQWVGQTWDENRIFATIHFACGESEIENVARPKNKLWK
jgi:integrase